MCWYHFFLGRGGGGVGSVVLAHESPTCAECFSSGLVRHINYLYYYITKIMPGECAECVCANAIITYKLECAKCNRSAAPLVRWQCEIKNTHHLGRVRAHTCVYVHSLTSRDYRPIGTTATAQKWCCRKCSARVKYAVLIEFQRLRVCGYRYRRAPAAGQQINLNVIKNVVQFAFNVWFLRTLSNRHHRFANKMHTQTRLTDE